MTYVPPRQLVEWLTACREIAAPVERVGPLVWDCVVPAEWCPPGNTRDGLHWSTAHRLRERVRDVMRRQGGELRGLTLPLPGRPVVVCVRYTPHRTDPRSNWDKFPVDMLQPQKVVVTRKGVRRSGLLGVIADDSGEHIDLRAWWERSKLGVVYVRVFHEPA